MSKKDLKKLSKMEFKNNSIKILNLSQNHGNLEKDLTFLRRICQSKSITHLDLSSWYLGPLGLKVLGESLKTSSPLISLILDGKMFNGF
jgi:Ran GTPase-activating protein (RanGAP) involved in mRNA processing and transport